MIINIDNISTCQEELAREPSVAMFDMADPADEPPATQEDQMSESEESLGEEFQMATEAHGWLESNIQHIHIYIYINIYR